MLTTRFTKLVGCTVPIQQAGMGAAAPPELAAAGSEAGAFGMLGTARGGLNATTLAGMLDRTMLREFRDRKGATVVYGHDAAQWQELQRAPEPLG